MKRVIARSVVPLVVLIVGCAIVLRLVVGIDTVRSLPPLERPWLVAPAFVLIALTLLTYAIAWRAIMSDLDDERPPLLDSVAVFTCSWLGRYVPTSAPYVAGKIVLGGKIGHRRAALAASILYENVLVVLVYAGASALILAMFVNPGAPSVLWVALSIGCVGAVWFLGSSLLSRLLRRIETRIPRLAVLQSCQLTPGGLTRSSVVVLMSAPVNGAAFVCILGGFAELSPTNMVVAGAAFNLAGAAGIAAVPLPSGIIVREAVLVAILQSFVPIEIALAAAVLFRFMTIPVDILFGSMGAARLKASAVRYVDHARGSELAYRDAA